MTHAITSLSELAGYWKANTTPIYFISPTHFNLMGMEHWVGGWTHVNFLDTCDGHHPNILVPARTESPVFESMEALNAYLLGHRDFIHRMESDRNGLPTHSPKSRVMFLFFDDSIESLCRELDLDIMMPPHNLRTEIDSKVVTTELGNSVGVSSVPNVLVSVKSYRHLMETAQAHGLGTNLVVQTPYGDSGKTTFFINSESDYDAVASDIESQKQVKIMKRIQCLGTAIEACATRCGTFVGPLMGELIGNPLLTPYPGGWCGNDLYPDAFGDDIRRQAVSMTQRLGDALYSRGYRGYFEVDYLLDLQTGALYLGEINPRISGVTAMTNLSPFCQHHVPLFLLHLSELSDLPLDIDPAEFNEQSLTHGADGATAQFILKYTPEALNMITDAPVSGVYHLSDTGNLVFERAAVDRRETGPNDLFLLRIMNSGEYAYHGADLAIAFLNIPLIGLDRQLTPDAAKWIKATRNAFVTRPLTDDEYAIVDRYNNPGVSFKGIGSND